MRNSLLNQIIKILFIIVISVPCYATSRPWDYDKSDWSSLMLATYEGKYKKMERLILKQVDVNYYSKKGLDALDIAIRKEDIKAVNILLDCGKLIPDSFGNAVMLASGQRSIEVLKALIAHHYPVKTDVESNGSPLMRACSWGSPEMVDYLIKLGEKVNEQTTMSGITPLMYAISSHEIEKVKILLANGADKNIADKNGNTAIDLANRITDEKIKKEITGILR